MRGRAGEGGGSQRPEHLWISPPRSKQKRNDRSARVKYTEKYKITTRASIYSVRGHNGGANFFFLLRAYPLRYGGKKKKIVKNTINNNKNVAAFLAACTPGESEGSSTKNRSRADRFRRPVVVDHLQKRNSRSRKRESKSIHSSDWWRIKWGGKKK